MKKKPSSSDSAKNQRLEHASNNSNSSNSTTNNNNSNNNKTDLNSNHIGLIPNQFEEIVPPNEHVPNPSLIQNGPYECKSCHSRFVHDYQVEFPILGSKNMYLVCENREFTNYNIMTKLETLLFLSIY